jgi:DNA repair protein REV1
MEKGKMFMAYKSEKEYFEQRTRKLNLIDKSRQNESENPMIFKGKTFYINGFTSEEFTLLELRKILVSYGGKVVNQVTKMVDFVIATQLCDQKKIKNTKIAIKPSWVFDSIKALKMVPIHDYLLYRNSMPDQTLLQFPKQPDSPSVKEFIQTYFKSSRLHLLTMSKFQFISRMHDKMLEKYNVTMSKIIKDSYILHVDMDSFFVSVMLRNRPDLMKLPVAVSHGSTNNSTADIASCNYVARQYGIRNGMLVGKARILAPDLKLLPYNFDEILKCSDALYNSLLSFDGFIQAVSCDEAYIDITQSLIEHDGDKDKLAIEIAGFIKQEIYQATNGCSASIGIGNSMLRARMATIFAKPNGIFLLNDQNFHQTSTLSTKDLPNIGYHGANKLAEIGVETCGECSTLSLNQLQELLGQSNGEKIYKYSRGIDNREYLQNKLKASIGAEINWGVRLRDREHFTLFIQEMCNVVIERMKDLKGNFEKLTINAKKRDYIGEPTKYLGCGKCIDYTKTISIDKSIGFDQLLCNTIKILDGFDIPIIDIRGIGIHVKAKAIIEKPLPKGQLKLNMNDFKKPIGNQVNPRKRKNSQEFMLKGDFTMSQLAPTSSQIDQSILNCLPKDIQNEQKTVAKFKSKNNCPKSPIKHVPEMYLVEPLLNGVCGIQAVIDMIHSWIDYCISTLATTSDVHVIIQYLIDLIDYMELETSVGILKTIGHRFGAFDIKGKGNVNLIATYEHILQQVNEYVEAKYGTKLGGIEKNTIEIPP